VPADEHRHAQERLHRRVTRGKPVRALVVADGVQPQRPGIRDQRAQDPVAAGRVPDGAPEALVGAIGDESLEPLAARVEDPEAA
jgi:hypothetical protein